MASEESSRKMWRFLIGHNLALPCFLPGSRPSSASPLIVSVPGHVCFFGISQDWTRVHRLITAPCTPDSSGSQWVLFSQARGGFVAREDSLGRKSTALLVWGALSCCPLIRFPPLFTILWTSRFIVHTYSFWCFLGSPKSLCVCVQFLRKSIREMVCVCICERERENFLMCCNSLIISSVYFWWCHVHKSDESFLRRKPERPLRSQLEGTNEIICCHHLPF